MWYVAKGRLLRFQDNKLGPSSNIKQFKKKDGNMQRHQYMCGGISSVLFSGRLGKPTTMLEHRKEKRRKKQGQSGHEEEGGGKKW